MTVKTLALEATTNLHFTQRSGPVYTSDSNTATMTVGVETDVDNVDYAAYEWNPISDPGFSEVIALNAVISKIELHYWVNLNNNIITLQFVKMDRQPSANIPTADLFSEILDHPALYATDSLTDNNREKRVITLGTQAATDFINMILNPSTSTEWFGIGIKREASIAGPGSVSVGGVSLVAGAEWREMDSGEANSPPLLVITYSTAPTDQPNLEMRYTTADPTTSQLTPSNSIGGHVAPNKVYPTTTLSESISSTQIFVPVDSLPVRSGLASVGPEIFKYNGLDSNKSRLLNVTRGISPDASFPAGFTAYSFPETVHYLHPDDVSVDLKGISTKERLFDTKATLDFVQYRCVSIFHAGPAGFNIKDVKVELIQKPDSDVQVDIGIEVPKFDNHTGTNTVLDSDGFLVTDHSFDSFTSGFFDNALMFLPNQSTEFALVSSFDDGQFILQSSVGSLAAFAEFRIFPAASQTVSTELVSPDSNAGKFKGFLGDGGSSSVVLEEHLNVMEIFDCFYIWIKRTFTSNVEKSDDTGALISLVFTDSGSE